MKKLALVSLVFALGQVAVLAGAHDFGHQARLDRHDSSESTESWSERDEISKTFDLTSGARIDLSGVNGTVTVENSAGLTAEVQIVRLAKTRAALDARKFTLEMRGNDLVVKGEKQSDRSSGHAREEVTLRIPRSVSLDISGINGRVEVAEIDGAFNISGVNGQVRVAKAGSASSISGINGGVTIALRELSGQGMRISGINGQVAISFESGLDADLNVSGINGRVITDGSPMTFQGKVTPSSFNARIGAGGPKISVSGVNGNVKLQRHSGER